MKKTLVIAVVCIITVLNILFLVMNGRNTAEKKTESEKESSQMGAFDSEGSKEKEPHSQATLSDTDISQSDISETDAPIVSDSEAKPAPDLNQYAMITQNANLRKEASSDSKKIDMVTKGSKVIVVGVNSKETWYNVVWGEKTGWLHKNSVELIRNRELDAVLYPAVPEQVVGQIHDINGTAVDKYMGEIAEDYHATGIQIAIIEKGNVAYTMEYGSANLEKKTEVTADTKFRIASLTKVFTTMNIMKAAEDGTISLDEDTSEIIGRKNRNPYFSSTPITMKMLVTHTSSFKDNEETYELYPWTQLSKKKSYHQTKPGTRFNYSNYGMGFAAACLEKRTDKQISQVADDYFLDKMNIDAAYDGSRIDDKSLVSNLYSGSVVIRSADKLCKAPRFSTPGNTYDVGAGGLIISAKDYAALITILINKGEYKGERYLSEATVEQMLTPQLNGIGYKQCIGIRLKENVVDGRTMYYHPGSMHGIFSLMGFDPEDGSGFVVVTNGARGTLTEDNMYRVCVELAQLCYDEIINA